MAVDLAQLTGGYDAPNSAVAKIMYRDYTHSDPWPKTARTAAPQQTAQKTTAPTPPVDPYAKWGGQDQFNAYNNQYHSGISNVDTGARAAFGNLGSMLQGSAEDIFDKYRVGQQGIDTSRANNELNRMTSVGDIVNYVRNGIRQGYSRLANSNAVDSSAAGALTNAYTQTGSGKVRGVNNQAGIASSQLDQDQSNLDLGRRSDVHAFQRQRDQQVNSIAMDVYNKLATLDQSAVGLSLPDRVNIDAEKQRIVQEGRQKLAGAQSWLNDQLGTLHPLDNAGILKRATQLQHAGAKIENPFNVGPVTQTQVTGPTPEQLPIFTARRRRT